MQISAYAVQRRHIARPPMQKILAIAGA